MLLNNNPIVSPVGSLPLSGVAPTAALQLPALVPGIVISLKNPPGTLSTLTFPGGSTSLTPYALLAGGTADNIPLVSLPAGTGTTGGLLVSAGSAAYPTWLSPGTSGQVLTIDPTTLLPSWSTAGAGTVTSVSNYDGTLTISPTTGNVVASLNLANPNTWTALQTFNDDVVVDSYLWGQGDAYGNPYTFLGSTCIYGTMPPYPPVGTSPPGSLNDPGCMQLQYVNGTGGDGTANIYAMSNTPGYGYYLQLAFDIGSQTLSLNSLQATTSQPCYATNGTPGVWGTFANPTSITVMGGIITAIS
jgi:hypothetical protein